MNFIDLCAGIGGIRLGLEQAGHKCVGFCEFDKFAIQSYKAIHNTEGEWEAHDITGVTDDDIKKLAKERTIDIICGGFPCQAFSVAGKRKGFADTRGTIFFEICRFIRIIKPKYFICENVKGLLSHEGGGKLSELSSKPWQNWGIAWNGRYLTAKILECLKTGSACSLSDILEREVEEKYFLSSEQTEKILANYKK